MKYEGFCLGGPMSGQQVARETKRFRVPVLRDLPAETFFPPFHIPTHLRHAVYEWNENQGTFIFDGYE